MDTRQELKMNCPMKSTKQIPEITNILIRYTFWLDVDFDHLIWLRENLNIVCGRKKRYKYLLIYSSDIYHFQSSKNETST